MGPLGWQETIFIFVIALLVFGPKKLPELGRNIGKAMSEFRRASSELKTTWDRQMVELEKETQPIKQIAQEYSSEIRSSYDDNNYDSYDYSSDASHSYSNGETPTVGASATEGAEQIAEAETPAAAPEGTVARTEETPAAQEPVKA